MISDTEPKRRGTAAQTPTREDSSVSIDWVRQETAVASEQDVVWARKVHEFFSATAMPTAVVIGLFFLALFLKAKIEAHTVGRIIAGYCVAMSVVMTGLLVYCHLATYTNPPQQRRIIRILLMVPIYAVDSYIALWAHSWAPVVGLIRDCYESYVIFTFFHLLMDYLGGEEAALRGTRRVKWMAPLCCLGEFNLDAATLHTWKLLLVQYMVLKPVMSLIAVYLMMTDRYDEGSWNSDNPHVYFVVILNVSVTCAFTCLVYFFVEFKSALQQHNPVGKFAAVKAVVFLTFWQSVLLGLLVHLGFIQGSKSGLWTKDEVSTGVQDFLICLEMLLMCYVHHKVFPEEPYMSEVGYTGITRWALWHAFSVRDVLDDTIDTALRSPQDMTHTATTIATTTVDDSPSNLAGSKDSEEEHIA